MAKRIQINGNSQPPIGNSSSGGDMYDAGNGYKVTHPKLAFDGLGVAYFIVLKQSEYIQLGALLMKYLGPGGQIVRMSDIPSSELTTMSSLTYDIQEASKQQQKTQNTQGPSNQPSNNTQQATNQSANYDAARTEAVQIAKSVFQKNVNVAAKYSSATEFSDTLDQYSLTASQDVIRMLQKKYNLSSKETQALSVEAGDAIYILARNAGLVDQSFKPTGVNVSTSTNTNTNSSSTTPTPTPTPIPKPNSRRTRNQQTTNNQTPPTPPVPPTPRNPKQSPITTVQIDDNLLSQEVMKGSGDTSTSAYKTLAPDALFGAQVENFTRTYGASFYRQNQVNLRPALARDVAPKAARAKTQQELDKVIKDTIGLQTKYLNDLVTNINNAANLLGTTAQVRMENASQSDPEGKDPATQELVAFYQNKIDEIKSVEASLETYAQSVIGKLSKQVTTIATKSFRQASIQRDADTKKKTDIREAKILKKYEAEFQKEIKAQLDIVAKKTAFEQAQQFIDNQSAQGIESSKIMPEAKRVYDVTREEIIRGTKIESKLDRDEIISRYDQQNQQFRKSDFVSEVTESPQILDAKKRFELEFRLGLVKSGQEILNYFSTVGKSVPQNLEKVLNRPTFTSESGTVFGSGITNRNRDAIAKSLSETFESAAGPAPYIPPAMQPDPTYVERLEQNAPSRLRGILKYLTTTSKERNPISSPPPGSFGGGSGKGGGGTFDKGGLSFPEGGDDPKKRLGFKSLAEVYGRVDLARQRLGMVANVAKAGASVPIELMSATENATTAQGVASPEVMGKFVKGSRNAIKLGSTAVGAYAGGAMLGGILGTFLGPGIGTAAGMAVGGMLGGAAGSAGSAPLEMIPLLSTIADNTAKSASAFSPEILAAKLDGQLKMLQMNIDTGERYGRELSELTAYSNSVREEMYKLGVEFLITFKPLIEDMTSLVIFIIGHLRSIMNGIYAAVETIMFFTPLIAPIRITADLVQRWIGSTGKKDPTEGGFRNNTTAFMQNRPDNPNL